MKNKPKGIRLEYWLFDLILKAAGMTDSRFADTVGMDHGNLSKLRRKGRGDPHAMMPEYFTDPVLGLAEGLAGKNELWAFYGCLEAVRDTGPEARKDRD